MESNLNSSENDEDSQDEDYSIKGVNPKRKVQKDYILSTSKITLQN